MSCIAVATSIRRKRKHCRGKKTSGIVLDAAVLSGGKLMLSDFKPFLSIVGGTSRRRGGRMCQTPLVRSDEDSNTVRRQKRISHRQV